MTDLFTYPHMIKFKIHVLNIFIKKKSYCSFFYLKDLNNRLKWESSRNNQLFPHYYGKIKKTLMINFFELKT